MDERKMRVFIITRFKDGEQFEALRDELKKYGIEVTHDWYTPMKERVRQGRTDVSVDALIADIAGIKSADCVVSLAPRGYDSYVEIGAAIMAEKPIVFASIDTQECGYSAHPCVTMYPKKSAAAFAEMINEIVNKLKAAQENRAEAEDQCAERAAAVAAVEKACVWFGSLDDDDYCPVCREVIDIESGDGHQPDCPYPAFVTWDKAQEARVKKEGG